MIGSKYYTGIGSRETPYEILRLMRQLGYTLHYQGWWLRSGGADGADMAFEKGAGIASGAPYKNARMSIYLPWNGFNGHEVGHHLDAYQDTTKYQNHRQAEEIASQIHPAWDRCTRGAKALHTRNVYQVLGSDLKTPSKFLICWAIPTKTGVKGGTNTAVQLALKHGVKVSNLYDDHTRERLEGWVKLYEQP